MSANFIVTFPKASVAQFARRKTEKLTVEAAR